MGARKLSYHVPSIRDYNEEAKFLSVFSKKETPEKFFSASKSSLYYSPFGMLLPNRHEASNEYRWGFNGMEKDDEVSGEGNSYDFGARLYNPRVGRWMSCDPLERKYPSVSSYNFAMNNPNYYIDFDGRDIIPSHKITYTHHVGEVKVKSIHDLGQTGVKNIKFTPGKNGKIGTVELEVSIQLNWNFKGNFTPTENPDLGNAFNKNNPGLHDNVKTHELNHYENLKYAMQRDDYSISLQNGKKIEGKLDAVYQEFYDLLQVDRTNYINYLSNQVSIGGMSVEEKNKKLQEFDVNQTQNKDNFDRSINQQIFDKSNENWESKTQYDEEGNIIMNGEEQETIDCTIEELESQGKSSDYQKGKPVVGVEK